MSGDHFDTLDTARDLEASGIERPRAEAIARAIGRTGDRLATKDDLEQHEASTKAGFERFESTMKADFERFRSTMLADFERFQAVMKADLANLRADMYRALWIQGAGIVAIVTALEFLP